MKKLFLTLLTVTPLSLSIVAGDSYEDPGCVSPSAGALRLQTLNHQKSGWRNGAGRATADQMYGYDVPAAVQPIGNDYEGTNQKYRLRAALALKGGELVIPTFEDNTILPYADFAAAPEMSATSSGNGAASSSADTAGPAFSLETFARLLTNKSLRSYDWSFDRFLLEARKHFYKQKELGKLYTRMVLDPLKELSKEKETLQEKTLFEIAKKVTATVSGPQGNQGGKPTLVVSEDHTKAGKTSIQDLIIQLEKDRDALSTEAEKNLQDRQITMRYMGKSSGPARANVRDAINGMIEKLRTYPNQAEALVGLNVRAAASLALEDATQIWEALSSRDPKFTTILGWAPFVDFSKLGSFLSSIPSGTTEQETYQNLWDRLNAELNAVGSPLARS